MDEDGLRRYCKEKNIFLNALIEITNACNLRCQHCYVCGDKTYLPLSFCKELVAKLKAEGTIYIILTGGEVFTHPEFTRIYKLLKENGFVVTIKTNALLLDGEHVKLFKELPPAQLDITVYGLNNQEYFEYCGDRQGFSRIEKALDVLSANSIRFSLCTIADKFHYPRIVNSDYLEFFKEYERPLECNYDLHDANAGSGVPLRLRINNNQIIEVENMQLCSDRSTMANYKPTGNRSGLSCRGGICNISIDFEGNISICLIDKEKVKLDFDDWPSVKGWLHDRNKEVLAMFKESKCYRCDKEFMCQKCPLWHQRTHGGNVDDRCELANMRASLWEELIVKNLVPSDSNKEQTASQCS